MKMWTTAGLATALLFAATVRAEDLVSGLQVGASVPAFQVVKTGGVEDGVAVGKQLCYR